MRKDLHTSNALASASSLGGMEPIQDLLQAHQAKAKDCHMRQRDLKFTFAVLSNHLELEVVEFTLEEALSEPFRLTLDLASYNGSIDFAQVLDQPALLTIWEDSTAVRHVHGLISSFTQGTTGFRRTRYRAVVEPQLARLALSSNWRIFQQKACRKYSRPC